MLAVLLQVIGVLLGGFVAYSTFVFAHHQWRLRRFPGPLSFPLVGSLWDPSFLSLYKHFHTMRRRFGKLVVFFSWNRPNLLVCDPLIARRILSDSKTFFKGSDYTDYFARAFGKGLVTSNGEDHRRGKAVLGKYFIRSSVAAYAPAFNGIVRKMVAQFLDPEVGAATATVGTAAGTNTEKKGVAVNMEMFFARLALRAFMRFSCAVDPSQDPKFEEKLCHKVSQGSFAVAVTLITAQPNSRLFPHTKIVLETRDMVNAYFTRCVAERRARLAAGEKFDDMLQALLDDASLTPGEREDHFMTIICAGHDTTAFFMSYLVYLLARNPDIQEKLYAHVEEVLGTDHEKDVTADDVARLKYLHCVMMETLRLYPVIPNVTRECAEDVHIKDENIDVVIPKDCNIFIPFIVLNKDPEIWDEPDAFRPDRFSDKAGADFTLAKNGFFPFSFGSRICVGNTLAQIESGIAIVHLIRRFKLSEQEGFRPKIRGGISLTTTNGMQIVVSPR